MGAGQQPPPPPPPGGWNREEWRDWGQRLRTDIHQRSVSDWRPPRAPHGIVIGMFIVLVGILLLLSNLGIPLVGDVWRFWPVILIIIGGSRMIECRSSSGLIWGCIVAGIGVIFLHDNLGIHIRMSVFWPVILIAVGLSMLARHTIAPFGRPGPPWPTGGGPTTSAPSTNVPPGPSSSAPDFHLWAFFGGGRRRMDTKQFRGGDVLAVFGGYQIDLRDAAISDGKAVIDANAMFGGIDIYIPQNWTIEVAGHGIFGGYDDKTLPPRIAPGDKPQHLIVTGYAMFGGVTVKN